MLKGESCTTDAHSGCHEWDRREVARTETARWNEKTEDGGSVKGFWRQEGDRGMHMRKSTMATSPKRNPDGTKYGTVQQPGNTLFRLAGVGTES